MPSRCALVRQGSLEAPGGTSAVSGVDFVVEPVMAPQEIQAVLPAALFAATAPCTWAFDSRVRTLSQALLQATSETGGELAETASEEAAEGVQEPPAEALE